MNLDDVVSELQIPITIRSIVYHFVYVYSPLQWQMRCVVRCVCKVAAAARGQFALCSQAECSALVYFFCQSRE